MKVCLRILSFCILMFFGHVALAQYMTVPYTINTSHGAVHGSYQIYNGVSYNNNYGRTYEYDRQYKFEVKLKNDSVLKVESSIGYFDRKEFIGYKEKDQQRMINSSDTKNIVAFLSDGNVIAGIPTDSCWLFLVRLGRIKCYSDVPEVGKENYIAIQKASGGVIVALNRKNLLEMINTDDREVLKRIDKGQLVKVVNRYNELAYSK